METDKIMLGALLLIVGVVVINAAAYAAARGWARSDDWSFIKKIGQSARPKENDALSELRRKVEDLQKERKEN